MKTAIATSELTGTNAVGERKRLTIAVGAPERDPNRAVWSCRVTIADVLKPTTVEGRDSFDALTRAVARVRSQLDGLRAEGWSLAAERGE